jgi:uncharacterized protein DUF1501
MTMSSRNRAFSRRSLLQIGSLGLCGLNLADLLRAEAQARTTRSSLPPVKACIVIFYYGGPSQLDTWDMKPKAPREVRGEFEPIATSAPGVFVSEQLPHSARVMDRVAIIRSFHHPMRNHNSAAVEALCGRTPLKGDLELLTPDANDFPCYGATLSAQLGGNGLMPAFVALPHVMYNVVKLPGQSAGFLGSAHEPFQVASDPNSPGFRIGELELPADLTADRLENRSELLRTVDDQVGRWERRGQIDRLDQFSHRAIDLLRSPAVRRAFDLSREDPRLRDRYGRTTHGQSVLLARRLIEAGVRAVCVYDKVHNGPDNWDTHDNNFGRLKNLLPPADTAFGALVEDLDRRGLLESTLVITLGEFGRTPILNKAGGRDHWPDCFSVVMAGGGVQGGMCYGSSDKIGAYPDANPVSSGDLAATIFWRFGLEPSTEMHDLNSRPYTLASGQPVRALFGA